MLCLVPAPTGESGPDPYVLLLQLMELPESSMFVGRTKLSMRDIRSFNSLQNNLYLLHKSDCRWVGHRRVICCPFTATPMQLTLLSSTARDGRAARMQALREQPGAVRHRC